MDGPGAISRRQAQWHAHVLVEMEQATVKPEVGYTLDASNLLSGTEMDPLSQDPTIQLLRRLRSALPPLDLTWMDHFLPTLFDDDRQIHSGGSRGGQARVDHAGGCRVCAQALDDEDAGSWIVELGHLHHLHTHAQRSRPHNACLSIRSNNASLIVSYRVNSSGPFAAPNRESP